MKALLFSILLLILISCAAVAQGEEEPVVAAPKIVRPQAAKTTLRARVFYEDTGRAVRRMSVMLMPIEGSGRDVSGITDNDGNLEIKNVPTGRYYAFINAPGVVSPTAYADLRKPERDSLGDAAAGFPVIDVDGFSDINIQIGARRGGAIGGRVTYSNGDPAIGVKVEILRKVGDEYLPVLPNLSALVGMYSGGGLLQTDDRGIYRMSGLPEGEYVVKVSESANHGKPDTRNGGYGGGIESMLFGGSSMLNVFYDNAFDQEKAQKINLQLGQDLSEINITIPDRELRSIEGKLVAAKDKLPIRNAKLTIKRADDETTDERGIFPKMPQVVYTDGKGMWRFNELPKGSYKIVAESIGSNFDAKDQAYGNEPPDPSEIYSANAANVAYYNTNAYGGDRGPIKPPEPDFAKTTKEFTIEEKDLTEQVIELSFGATLTGTVVLEKPKGLSGGISITAKSEKDDISASTSVSLYEFALESGKPLQPQQFRLDGVTLGKNSISITPNGQNTDYYVKSAASNQIDLLKGPFDFKDREVFANIRIVLASDVGILKGTVMDSGRQPVAGLTLTFVPTDPAKFATSTYFRTARTNTDGEFEIKLPPFEYAVVFIPAGTKGQDDIAKWLTTAVKQAQSFKIEAGATSKATIKFDRQK